MHRLEFSYGVSYYQLTQNIIKISLICSDSEIETSDYTQKAWILILTYSHSACLSAKYYPESTF